MISLQETTGGSFSRSDTYNWDLFVFGPEFAILRMPLPEEKKTIAFSVKFNIHETFSLKMTAP